MKSVEIYTHTPTLYTCAHDKTNKQKNERTNEQTQKKGIRTCVCVVNLSSFQKTAIYQNKLRNEKFLKGKVMAAN